ncbi:hypothetical protein KJ682_07835 [bacterium]|nr:hypothetical protein [bacterium]
MPRILTAILTCLLLAPAALADQTVLLPILCGHDEREDAPSPCLQEDAFTAGVASADLSLMTGGQSWGCNSEWAAFVEFDLSWLPPGHQVLSAVLTVRKTGYSDDSQGFFYLGVFPYFASGGPMAVPRDDLDPDTALDVTYPPAANVDLVLDVTAGVQDLRLNGHDRIGLILAGIYSEAGYEDWISIGGCGHPNPPRLALEYEGTVDAEAQSWSGVKSLFR